MFNLEQAIAEWRQRMLAAGIKSPVPLEELEEHLREEIDALIESGETPEMAFELAMEKIGDVQALKAEFLKTRPIERPSTRLRIFQWIVFLCVIPWATHDLFAHSMNLEWRVGGVANIGLLCFAIFESHIINIWHDFLPVVRSHRLRSLITILCWFSAVGIDISANHWANKTGLSVGPEMVLRWWTVTVIIVLCALIPRGLKFVAERENTSTES